MDTLHHHSIIDHLHYQDLKQNYHLQDLHIRYSLYLLQMMQMILQMKEDLNQQEIMIYYSLIYNQ